MKILNVKKLLIVFLFLLIPYMMSFKLYIVASGSMEPTLKVNELIFVRSQKEYEIGDIITFYDETLGGTTTHRIVNIEKNGEITTKGDYNNTEDYNKITNEKIIGKVIFSSMILGIIVKSQITQIIAIILVFIYLVFLLKTIVIDENKK